jgi:hypothetical protein
MNDFTKDELYIILIDMQVRIVKSQPLNPAPSYLALRDKVRGMIDNYCEHEFKSCLQEVIGYQCDGCFKVFNDE